MAWRPLTLKWPVISLALGITLLLIAAAGLLFCMQKNNGLIYAADNTGEFSTVVNLLSQYIPTIIAVIYGIIWGWIGLDVKRLEPWFQLSKNSGASAKESILLHYPIDFLAFVPFKAARRRHWTVLSASTIMVLVFWMITPLLSSMFAVTTLAATTDRTFPISAGLISSVEQTQILNTNFLNTAFGVLWLGQGLPAFTTKNYTLQPFLVAADDSNSSTSQVTYTYETTLYSTNLHCTAPAFVGVGTDSRVTFVNGRGCNTSISVDVDAGASSATFSALYIGYFNDVVVDYALAGPACPQNSSQEFLAIWNRFDSALGASGDLSSLTALFCSADYFAQRVNATVSSTDFAVVNVTPLESPTTLTDDQFNRTHFEYILGAGVPPQLDTSTPIRGDILDSTYVAQDTQLSNMSIVLPTTNMVGFAIGATHLQPQQYLDPVELSSAFNAAHQLLFAVAARALMAPARQDSNGIPVSRNAQMQSIVLVNGISIAVIVALLGVLFTAIYLFAASHHRALRLKSDPDSITELMILSRDASFRALISRHSGDNNDSLDKGLDRDLLLTDTKSFPMIQIGQMQDNRKGRQAVLTAPAACDDKPQQLKYPTELGIFFGGGFAIALASVLVAITFLYFRIKTSNGLRLPATSTTVQQIILSYIPTYTATLIEPFWVLVIRLVCMLQPFHVLRNGAAPAEKSLALTYTAMPPQLIFGKAIRNGHLLIATLGVLAVMANVLTVAMNGLFFTKPTLQPEVSSGFATNLPEFGKNPFDNSYAGRELALEPVYLIISSISEKTALPAWLGQRQYFMPVGLPFDESTGSATYEMNIAAIGAGLDCQELRQSDSTATYEFVLSADAKSANLTASFLQSDGSNIKCQSTIFGGLYGAAFGLGGVPVGHGAVEIITEMATADNAVNSAEVNFCSNSTLYGWIRSDILLGQNTTNTSPVSLNSTFMSCRPRVYTTPYQITTNPSGVVLTASPVDSPVSTSNLTAAMNDITQRVDKICTKTGRDNAYHNDSFASDWPNYLIKLLTNNTGFVNPSNPPPTFEVAHQLVDEVYGRIWAAQLGLESSYLAAAPANAANAVPVTKLVAQTRVFMSDTMFWIAFTILLLDIVAAVFLYSTLPKPFLPRMPTSVANVVTYFATSHCVVDVVEDECDGEQKGPSQKNRRYGYGKFVGMDGRVHSGIERYPFVTSLDTIRRRRRA